MQRNNLLKVRQSVAVLEQFCENNKDEAKAYPEIPKILDYISALSQDQKPEIDSQNIELLRQELARFLAKEPALVANESIFEAAYYLQYACAKYWPKNLRNAEGKLLSYFTGNPINCPIFLAGTGYAYECNEDFFEKTMAGHILYPTTMDRFGSSIIQPSQLLTHNLSIREKAYINKASSKMRIVEARKSREEKLNTVMTFTTIGATLGFILGIIFDYNIFAMMALVSRGPLSFLDNVLGSLIGLAIPVLGGALGGLIGFVAINVLSLLGNLIISAISSCLPQPNPPEANPPSRSNEHNILLKTGVTERFVTGGKQFKPAIVLPKPAALNGAEKKDDVAPSLYLSLAAQNSPKGEPVSALRANSFNRPVQDLKDTNNKPSLVPDSPRNGFQAWRAGS